MLNIFEISDGDNCRIKLLCEKTENAVGASEIHIFRVWGTNPVLTLPGSIDGARVTEIAPYCFARERRLPGGVVGTLEHLKQANKTFDNKDFRTGCAIDANLENVTELCGANVEDVTLPDTITKIGNLAFYNCNKLSHISIGTEIEAVGGDAFMNTVNLQRITVRGRANKPSCLRQILAQISSDMEVTFKTNDGIDAVIFFPDYYESLDEIAPAHLFGRNIEGEGFRARQCFKDGILDFAQYDTIFQKACAEENERTLAHMATSRLMYPIGMNDEARIRYESYAKAHAKFICTDAMSQRDLNLVRFYLTNHYADASVLAACITAAAELEWAEGAAALLRLKRELYEGSSADRYTF